MISNYCSDLELGPQAPGFSGSDVPSYVKSKNREDYTKATEIRVELPWGQWLLMGSSGSYGVVLTLVNTFAKTHGLYT